MKSNGSLNILRKTNKFEFNLTSVEYLSPKRIYVMKSKTTTKIKSKVSKKKLQHVA